MALAFRADATRQPYRLKIRWGPSGDHAGSDRLPGRCWMGAPTAPAEESYLPLQKRSASSDRYRGSGGLSELILPAPATRGVGWVSINTRSHRNARTAAARIAWPIEKEVTGDHQDGLHGRGVASSGPGAPGGGYGGFPWGGPRGLTEQRTNVLGDLRIQPGPMAGEQVLEELREVGAIVRSKADAGEAQAFGRWLVEV